jgi:hypothetical protein
MMLVVHCVQLANDANSTLYNWQMMVVVHCVQLANDGSSTLCTTGK